MGIDKIKKVLDFFQEKSIYPDSHVIIGSPTKITININNRNVLSFCSNDYLGLANNELSKKAAHNALDIYGIGSGGSRLISGNTDIQAQLEEEIAGFKGAEAAMTFVTGYMANSGVIPAIIGNKLVDKLGGNKLSLFSKNSDLIFSDEYNHASIIDGCRLSRAKIIVYKHRDMGDLEKKLKRFKKNRKLIVTDGVFSMDGDIAPLPVIVELAKKYNAMTMVDDAHGTGTLGTNGKGTLEYFGIDPKDVDIIMGTFTKSFGGIGGFVVGSNDLINYLRITARTYIFTAPIPPVICAGLLASIKSMKNNKDLIEKLWSNVAIIKQSLVSYGFNLLGSETQIIPIFIGDERKTIEFSRKLLEKDIFIPAVYWPAVPKGKARLRMTIRANYSKKNIEYLLENLKNIASSLNIIN